MYRVLLIDPTEADSPEIACECQTREEADAICAAWDQDPLGLVAIVWPGWAPMPGVVMIFPAPYLSPESDTNVIPKPA